MISEWLGTFSLIFGGCCSNAITLEQLTSQYPHAGSLITFFQFLIISIYGLPRHTTWTRYGPRFKARRIPLTPYLIQVALFYLISLLNNAAFSYRIPMAVHIIFRSGGLIISMLLGYVVGKRYTVTQTTSVLLVTLGVILTTLSASNPSGSAINATTTNPYTYAIGISILAFALLLSGFLGLVQDRTYSKYGRPTPPGSTEGPNKTSGSTPERKDAQNSKQEETPAWQESMFYLHFLALPMFLLVRSDLAAQFATVNSGPKVFLSFPLLSPLLPFLPRNSSFLPFSSATTSLPTYYPTFAFPAAYLPLLVNTFTQLFCVAGVHRLTTRVTALSVTLVLVVRKAVSLVLSVLGIGGGEKGPEVDKVMMWTGAVLVLAGTVGYTMGSGKVAGTRDKRERKDKKM